MQEALVVVAAMLAGAILAALLMATGYWAGRNSAERPFRSPENVKPGLPPELNRKPIPDPETGDVFNDAAFGEDKGPVSTLIARR
jgi:hypothetical protein